MLTEIQLAIAATPNGDLPDQAWKEFTVIIIAKSDNARCKMMASCIKQ